MSKNIIILIVLIVAIAGTLVVKEQNKKIAQQRQAQLKAAEEANQLAAEAQQAINEARRLEAIAKQEAKAFKQQIAARVSQAESLLNAGEYQLAIDAAKNILGNDVNNADAKTILETAVIKLKEIAQQKIDGLTKQAPKKIIEDTNLVPSIPEL